MTTGTRIAISISITRAMPSAAKVNRASQLGIQAYDSRNWNRSPPTLKATHMKMLRASTTTDQTSATFLARSPRDRGMNPTTSAPTSGRSVRTDRNGKSVTPTTPTGSRGMRRRPARHR